MTKINAIFHPRPSPTSIPMDLSELNRTTPIPSIVKKCSHEGFEFFCFEGTLEAGCTMISAPMTVPAYFEETNGEDCTGLYLLQSGIKAGTLKRSMDAFNEFFADMKSIGKFGCPQRVILGFDKKAGVKKKGAYSDDCFIFNNMRFYPFITKEFLIGYFVCDMNSKYRWKVHSPREKGVALDDPLIYDPTLGILVTRGAHIAY